MAELEHINQVRWEQPRGWYNTNLECVMDKIDLIDWFKSIWERLIYFYPNAGWSWFAAWSGMRGYSIELVGLSTSSFYAVDVYRVSCVGFWGVFEYTMPTRMQMLRHSVLADEHRLESESWLVDWL